MRATTDASARQPHGLVFDHLADGALVVAEFGQHFARMLADARGRAADLRLVQLEACGVFWLPYLPARGCLEFGDQAARDLLLFVDDLGAAQDGRAGDVGGTQPLEP